MAATWNSDRVCRSNPDWFKQKSWPGQITNCPDRWKKKSSGRVTSASCTCMFARTWSMYARGRHWHEALRAHIEVEITSTPSPNEKYPHRSLGVNQSGLFLRNIPTGLMHTTDWAWNPAKQMKFRPAKKKCCTSCASKLHACCTIETSWNIFLFVCYIYR